MHKCYLCTNNVVIEEKTVMKHNPTSYLGVVTVLGCLLLEDGQVVEGVAVLRVDSQALSVHDLGPLHNSERSTCNKNGCRD